MFWNWGWDPSEAKYFKNSQVEVETQRSKIFREFSSWGWDPAKQNISRNSKCRLRSPRSRNILKSLKVEVQSQRYTEGSLENKSWGCVPRPNIPRRIKTRLANYASHVCKFESSQREGQGFDLFRVYHILFYRQLPLLCDSRFDLIRQYECGLAVWFQKSTHRAKILSHVLVHSTWREEQDVLEFAAFVSSYPKSLHFRNLQIFPALLIFNVRL